MSDTALTPHLLPGDRLTWQGKPTHTRALGKGFAIIRFVGWGMLACFALFLALGLANLDEMEGPFAPWLGVVLLSGGLFVAFALIAPAYARAANARTRYGVTRSRAMILQSGRDLKRFTIPKDGRITRVEGKDGAWSVLIQVPAHRTAQRSNTEHSGPPNPIGFGGLSEADAIAAETALTAIRGKGR
ncbi:hypothetical protein [Vannielia sp.]|uniref:hypothetical protein n=1 Tax=Vannielia sp. TaxID=2813045 RepID=UPI002624C56B|nr:hypothetical protein [Vannielia sp.]MDF1871085.1 hypothetical protein [Vannielia sp.]